MQQKSFAIHTLGCKLNYSESSSLSQQLVQNGYQQKQFDEEADIYILNTCSVTDNADKECRQIIKKINKKTSTAFIVVTGCYAQLKPIEIANIKGVDLVLGASEKFNLLQHLNHISKQNMAQIHSCEIDEVDDFKSAFSFNDRTRAFLKIQDGCNYNCAYCTIPMARGKSRSNSLDNILSDINTLAQKNIKEVVLTGVNLGDYEYENKKFVDVVKALNNQLQIARYRISSIEPNLLTDDIIQMVSASHNFMPHFHIPLQSGSNKILGLMRRRYQKESYQKLIEKIKKQIPHCAIGVDVIVGFPDESEADFKDSTKFLTDLEASYLHVFTYSERSDTLATTFQNPVPMNIRKERNKILRSLSLKKTEAFKQQFAGTQRRVLFETQNNKNTIEGYTDNYIKVETFYKPELENQIVEWNI